MNDDALLLDTLPSQSSDIIKKWHEQGSRKERQFFDDLFTTPEGEWLILLLEEQGDTLDIHRIGMPQLDAQQLYKLAQFVIEGEVCGNVSLPKYRSLRNASICGEYFFLVPEFEKEEGSHEMVDITLEERLVLEIIYFILHEKRQVLHENIYCDGTKSNIALWVPTIRYRGGHLSVHWYCPW